MEFMAELGVARQIAESAGRLIAAAWDQGRAVSFKGEVDLVTEIDLAAEALIVEGLSRACPQDRIVAEEGGGRREAAARTWYVDPLDGTTNFAHGFPQLCVSIALVDATGVALGVVHEPLRRWTFYATRGGGAFRDGAPLKVSQTPRLEGALLATGFPYDRRQNPDNNVDRLAAFLKRGQGIRRAGSAALDLAFTAAGWLDGYWEDRLSPWDLAAGLCLVQEAGGRATGWGGAPPDLLKGALIASNGHIHEEMLQVIADVQRGG
ncbi:inositol monophosphatase [Myxococcota bacterium]|nr:inositol monophosphatase [Myxococcota bacterium]MBU1432024.1 inositol monophosphatase [Myxococcota bacterium]MBU1899678.1 inositol monophosphatase [Myxococcota bacterium]